MCKSQALFEKGDERNNKCIGSNNWRNGSYREITPVSVNIRP